MQTVLNKTMPIPISVIERPFEHILNILMQVMNR